MHEIKATLANLQAVVSRDNLRPAMQHVFYSPQRERVVCTNGHIAAFYHVEPDEGDVEAVIPIHAFNTAGIAANKKALPFLHLDVRVDEIRTSIRSPFDIYAGVSERITKPYKDEKYPNAYAILDKALADAKECAGITQYGLSSSNLRALLRAMPPKTEDFHGSFRFMFSKKNQATVVYPAGQYHDSVRPPVYFLVMPIMLLEDEMTTHLDGRSLLEPLYGDWRDPQSPPAQVNNWYSDWVLVWVRTHRYGKDPCQWIRGRYDHMMQQWTNVLGGKIDPLKWMPSPPEPEIAEAEVEAALVTA